MNLNYIASSMPQGFKETFTSDQVEETSSAVGPGIYKSCDPTIVRGRVG